MQTRALARGAARRGRGRVGAGDPQRDPGHRRGARSRPTTWSSSAGPASGSTTSTSTAATRRGVMVVNAPQSNILSAAEHTHGAAARPGPQRARRPTADLKAGEWNRSKWEGVELHGKTLGIVGLGRVGVLVAQRAHAFGMRLVAYDPFVSADRARQLGVELVRPIDELVRRADFLTIHLPKTPETVGPDQRPSCSPTPSRRCGSSTPPAAASSTRTRWPTPIARRPDRAAPRSTCSPTEPTTESPLFELDSVVVTPHLGASTAEAQDKAGETIAEQVVLALRGEFVPFAVNVAATEAIATRAAVPAARRAARPAVHRAGRRRRRRRSRSSYEGEIADYDCRVLTLSVLKGVLGPVVDEPVSFVNAPQLAEERGIVGARDDVVVGARLREPHRAARPHSGAQHACRGHAVRQAGRAAHRRHRRPHRRPAAVEPHARRAQRRHARA